MYTFNDEVLCIFYVRYKGKVCFLLGDGGGGGGSGYFRNFLPKKSRPSHFPEWINA